LTNELYLTFILVIQQHWLIIIFFIMGKVGLLLLFWTTHGVNIKILEEFSPLIIHFIIKQIPQVVNYIS